MLMNHARGLHRESPAEARQRLGHDVPDHQEAFGLGSQDIAKKSMDGIHPYSVSG